MFEWKDDYSIHIELSDAEHRKLFRIGEELHDTLMAESGKAALVRVLRRLIRSTASTFRMRRGFCFVTVTLIWRRIKPNTRRSYVRSVSWETTSKRAAPP